MAINIQVGAEGPLKRELLETAFGWFGSAGYEFGRTPEEISDALMRCNSMMRSWPWNALGYNQPTYGLGSPSDYSGIPFDVQEGVAAALATRIAAVMGATLPPEWKAAASLAISSVYSYTAAVPRMPHHRHTPRGLGSEHVIGIGFARPFIDECADDDDTVLTSGSTVANSNVIVVTSATGISTGQYVCGSGIPSGTTVLAISGTSITISNNATLTQANISLSFE